MNKVEITKCFSNGDFFKCFDYLSEETIWNTPGKQCLVGRKEIETFCRNVRAYFLA